jgi:hypothetical protein
MTHHKFAKLANLPTAAFLRWCRRRVNIALHGERWKLEMRVRKLLSEESNASMERARLLGLLRHIEEYNEELIRLNHEMLNNGLQVKIDASGFTGSYLDFPGLIEVRADYTSNFPPMQRMIETIVRLERRVIGVGVNPETAYYARRDTRRMRALVEHLSQLIAEKMIKDLVDRINDKRQGVAR